MRIPKFLPENGTIGFVAPSFGCNIEPYKSSFENALKRFEEMGYSKWLGPSCFVGEGIGISNKPELCGKELTDAFTLSGEDAPDVIISCGGGEMMCEVIPYIDFKAVKNAEPKWYMGYSDNTNFVYLSATIADTAAIYGPCAPAFGMEPWHESLRDAFDLIKGEKNSVSGYPLWEKEGLKDEEHPLLPYNVTEKTEYVYYLPDEVKGSEMNSEITLEGRLIGGCVDCLVNLLGTRYDKTADFLEKYKDDGFIWFLECCDLNPMSMRRAFWQMREAGWFKYVRCFMIGRPLHKGEEMFGADCYNSVTDIIGKLGVPIIMDLDIGHLPPMVPIICGAKAKASFSGNTMTVDYRIR